MGFHWQALGRRTQVLGIRTWSPELPLWSAWVHRQHWKPCRPRAAAAQQQQQQALAATNELLSDLMGFFTAESPFFGRMYVQPMRHRDVDAWRSNGDLELFHHINHSKPAVFLVINTYFLEFQAPFLDAVGFFHVWFLFFTNAVREADKWATRDGFKVPFSNIPAYHCWLCIAGDVLRKTIFLLPFGKSQELWKMNEHGSSIDDLYWFILIYDDVWCFSQNGDFPKTTWNNQRFSVSFLGGRMRRGAPGSWYPQPTLGGPTMDRWISWVSLKFDRW